MDDRMTTARSRPVTGVAKGSLGTGTALDDTQVYQVADLAQPEAVPEPVAAPREPAPQPPPARRAAARAAKAAAPVATAPSPQRVQPVVRRRRAAIGRTMPGAAWIAGTALVAVVVTAIVSSGLGAAHSGAELESGAPAAIGEASNPPTAAPTEAAGDGGGKGHGHGGGNGNGHGH
jgi:hypothetical protein